MAHPVAPIPIDADVPAGSASATTSAEPAGATTLLSGWYTDPADRTQQRYWDGSGWVGDSLPADDPHPAGPYWRPPVTDAIKAEVSAEADPSGVVRVPLYGDEGDPVTLRVLPARDWFADSMTCLQSGDFSGWAEDCLVGDDYDLWCSVNDGRGPRNSQVEAFFDEYGRRSGNDSGKSRALRRSWARTARR